ncbi:MAG: cell division ATP-binding protein FtsE [Acidobacteriota bacterium]
MIELYHVHKEYDRGFTALEDVSVNVAKGEFVFLTGASGAGKSTLLKLLYREIAPTRGQILVGGRNIGTMPASDVPALRREIGIVFQEFRLLSYRTVLENVEIGLLIQGKPHAERRRRAIQALRQVSLEHKLSNLPRQLSGGEQQRVAIARAIVVEPYLLLADEPTGNLDPELSLQIMQLLEGASAHGTTVIVATHDAALMQRFGKRRIVLERGRVIEGGEPS